jgi:aspartyl/asparaginyl beta-hydroxylase (cupin superfamily)
MVEIEEYRQFSIRVPAVPAGTVVDVNRFPVLSNIPTIWLSNNPEVGLVRLESS